MKKLNRILSIVIVCALCVLSTACGNVKSDKAQIVATIFPLFDFSREVAGDRADVTLLIKAGAEVHNYDPSLSDIAKIQDCDLFIYVGGESDVWVENILNSITRPRKVLRLMDLITPIVADDNEHEHDEDDHAHEREYGHEDEHEHGEYDEHIWTSPVNAMIIADAIADALSELDVANAHVFANNNARYQTELDTLHKTFKAVADAATTRTLVVADRFPFAYFVAEYGLDYVAALSGCASPSDVSPAAINNLVQHVNAHGIGFVYHIELSSRAIANTVAGETGAEILLLHSCQTVSLWEFESGATYLSIMRDNVFAIARGLIA